jgi:hypothetical protein
MHNKRGFASAVILPLTLMGFMACSGGHDSSADANLITVSTQCDTGASINPTSVQVHSGDKPTFNIALQSGYGIQTIYCTTGGTLIGTQFTMGAVTAPDNVHVVTTGRWVGAASQVKDASSGHVAEIPIVRSIEATDALSAKEFMSSPVSVRIENFQPDHALVLEGVIAGHKVTIPVVAVNPVIGEAHFMLDQFTQHLGEDKLPDMLRFDVVEEESSAKHVQGAIFIAVRK